MPLTGASMPPLCFTKLRLNWNCFNFIGIIGEISKQVAFLSSTRSAPTFLMFAPTRCALYGFTPSFDLLSGWTRNNFGDTSSST